MLLRATYLLSIILCYLHWKIPSSGYTIIFHFECEMDDHKNYLETHIIMYIFLMLHSFIFRYFPLKFKAYFFVMLHLSLEFRNLQLVVWKKLDFITNFKENILLVFIHLSSMYCSIDTDINLKLNMYQWKIAKTIYNIYNLKPHLIPPFIGEERKVMYRLGINRFSIKAYFLLSPFCRECMWNYYFYVFLCFRKSLDIKYYKIPLLLYISLSTPDFLKLTIP